MTYEQEREQELDAQLAERRAREQARVRWEWIKYHEEQAERLLNTTRLLADKHRRKAQKLREQAEQDVLRQTENEERNVA